MPRLRGLKSEIIAIALFALLNCLTPAGAAFAGGDDKTTETAATPDHATDTGKGGSKAAAPDARDASNSNATLANELQQLKDTVQAQAQRLIEHTQELESERTALHEELERIAKLESALNVTPDSAKENPAASSATAPPDAHVIRPPDAQAPDKQQVSITQVEHPLSFKI